MITDVRMPMIVMSVRVVVSLGMIVVVTACVVGMRGFYGAIGHGAMQLS